MTREAARRPGKNGIEISFYFYRGTGVRNRQGNTGRTVLVTDETSRDLARLCRLWINKDNNRYAGSGGPRSLKAAFFLAHTAEETMPEFKLLREQLNAINSFVTCDHDNNFIKVAGGRRQTMIPCLREPTTSSLSRKPTVKHITRLLNHRPELRRSA